MATGSRRRKVVVTPPAAGLGEFAEQLGESLGQGIARGLNLGLMGGGAAPAAPAPAAPPARRRGRPRKVQLAAAPVPADRRCTVEGCTGKIRSKGLCSRHYQAERRRLAKLA